jgi:protein tyrosine phosphatase
MIWQQRVLTIAMTTKVIEQRKLKCAQYWPLETDDVLELDNFVIKNNVIEDLGDFKITRLTITHIPVTKLYVILPVINLYVFI